MAKRPARKTPTENDTEGPRKRNALAALRLPEDYKAEWDRWQAHAAEEGIKEFRDWLFPKVRQALTPRPERAATGVAMNDVFKRGQRLGLMIGRLDAIFEHEQEDEIDLGWLTAWVTRYPDLVPDVVQTLSLRPYGERFHAWWTVAIGDPMTGSGARTLSARR